MGDEAVEDVASRASLSFRKARSIVDSSCEGGDDVGRVLPSRGEEDSRFGGEGLAGRPRRCCKMCATGGLRAESEDAETPSPSEREAKAESRVLE